MAHSSHLRPSRYAIAIRVFSHLHISHSRSVPGSPVCNLSNKSKVAKLSRTHLATALLNHRIMTVSQGRSVLVSLPGFWWSPDL